MVNIETLYTSNLGFGLIKVMDNEDDDQLLLTIPFVTNSYSTKMIVIKYRLRSLVYVPIG